MKLLSPSRIRFATSARAISVALMSLILTAVLSQGVPAQQQPAQLSLADILIALRSKKVTLAERNKLIGDAVKSRGITFTLTSEIEKELQTTGADPTLLDAIKLKGTVERLAQGPQPKADPVPAMDFGFYQKRADGSVAKGDIDSAVADYGKAIELRASDPTVYLSRGMALLNKKSFDLSIQDFNKVIELDPRQSSAYFNRGNSFERKGDTQKALDDYKKTLELDPNNEAAKMNIQRIQNIQAAEQAKLAAPQVPLQSQPQSTQPPPTSTQAQTQPVETPRETKTNANDDPLAALAESARPGSVSIGSGLRAQAIKLVMPAYSAFDRQRNLQGIVSVAVTLDEEGKVVEAKALTGPRGLYQPAEDAVRRTKFKPVLYNGLPIKATGVINFNFVMQ
jgi:tetratricopeptide (TPR) repeat protein